MADVDVGEVLRSAAQALNAYATKPPTWKPLPHQVPPPGDWYGWLLNAGRGSGKTDAVAHYVTEHVKGPACLHGPTPHWIGIIAPTLGDAVTACFAGPSGLRAHDPTAKLVMGAGGTLVRWPNGSEAKLFGAHEPEDVERLRAGGNRCLIWAEELAAWRYLQACWEQMRFGLRVGPRPRWCASTTPKPRPLIKKLVKETPHNVIVTRASTRDNPHLQDEVREALHEEYGGTQLGRQELDADLLEEDKDALWTREILDRYRLIVPPESSARLRTVVGVDPSGGAGEQGIVVVTKVTPEALVGLITDAHAYPGGPDPPTPRSGARAVHHGVVLDDKTCCLPPAGWGRRAVRAAIDWDADELVVERNFGGAMATATLLDACEAEGVDVPVKEVVASRGKRVRAEPVSALSARGRWHMAGSFPALEDQCCVVAGTQVVTTRGTVPIEYVHTGDEVWTRAGWQRVIWSGATGISDRLTVVRYIGGELVCTPDHLVWIDDVNDFVPAALVPVGATIQTCLENRYVNSWSIKESVTLRKVDTGERLEMDLDVGNYCTLSSTNALMDLRLLDITSTTSIMMASTMHSKISSHLRRLSTCVHTHHVDDTRKHLVLKAVGVDGPSGNVVNLERSAVEVASRTSSRSLLTPTTAQAVVHDVVTEIVPPTLVFNLMIRNKPEFYAGGVLVHNCTWTEESKYSPDRLDAMVWPAWRLKLVSARTRGVGRLPLQQMTDARLDR